MTKLEYARKMIQFHTRMLIKWSKYIEKVAKPKEREEQEVAGQLTIYDLENNDKTKIR